MCPSGIFIKVLPVTSCQSESSRAARNLQGYVNSPCLRRLAHTRTRKRLTMASAKALAATVAAFLAILPSLAAAGGSVVVMRVRE